MNSIITDIKLKGECVLDQLYAGNGRIMENAEIKIYDINKGGETCQQSVIHGDGHRDDVSLQSALKINDEFYYIECQSFEYSAPLGVFSVPQSMYEDFEKLLKLKKTLTGDVVFKGLSNDYGDVLVGTKVYETLAVIEKDEIVYCAFRRGWFGGLINKYSKSDGYRDEYPWLEVNIKKIMGIAARVLIPMLYLMPVCLDFLLAI